MLKKEILLLWFDDNFVGTELDPELSYAKVADACGLKGVTVRTMEETTAAIKQSCEDQKKGITTFIEVILNQELGEPFQKRCYEKTRIAIIFLILGLLNSKILTPLNKIWFKFGDSIK